MENTEETPHAATGLIHTIVNALATLGSPMEGFELPLDALTDKSEPEGVLVTTGPAEETIEDRSQTVETDWRDLPAIMYEPQVIYAVTEVPGPTNETHKEPEESATETGENVSVGPVDEPIDIPETPSWDPVMPFVGSLWRLNHRRPGVIPALEEAFRRANERSPAFPARPDNVSSSSSPSSSSSSTTSRISSTSTGTVTTVTPQDPPPSDQKVDLRTEDAEGTYQLEFLEMDTEDVLLPESPGVVIPADPLAWRPVSPALPTSSELRTPLLAAARPVEPPTPGITVAPAKLPLGTPKPAPLPPVSTARPAPSRTSVTPPRSPKLPSSRTTTRPTRSQSIKGRKTPRLCHDCHQPGHIR